MVSLHAISANKIRRALFLLCSCHLALHSMVVSKLLNWVNWIPMNNHSNGFQGLAFHSFRPREMAHCLNFGDKPSVTLTGQKLLCGSPRALPKLEACRGHADHSVHPLEWTLALSANVKSLCRGELWENEFQPLPALGGNQNVKDVRTSEGNKVGNVSSRV